MRTILSLTLVLSAAVCSAAEHAANDAASFDHAVKSAQPGDTIVLSAGEWANADLLFEGVGTADRPITLRAAEPGKVRLTGTSRLRLAGEHLVVEGLWFDDCTPKSEMIAFRRDSKRLAHRSVVRHCAITHSAAVRETADRKWVSIYGVSNRVERCHFEGKTSPGTLMIVWLPAQAGEPPRHRVAGNYFGPRPRLGKNGGEILRVGDSDTSMQTAECVVEGNWFERCDGEVECISNKSCGNVYRSNVFIETQGTLTLRHGNGCLVENNLFLGNGRKQTGGIRVIGEDHRVIGNYLEGLQGDEARAAICLMNGIENSPANGYFQVKRATVEGNTIVDCKQSILLGFADKDVKAALPPIDCTFSGNTVWADRAKAIERLDPRSGVAWKNNRIFSRDLGVPPVDGIATTPFDRPAAVARPDRAKFGAPWMRPAGPSTSVTPDETK